MNNLSWGWVVALGVLLTRLGFSALSPNDAAMPDLAVTLLLAGGMLLCLIGVTGVLGMLSWLPFHRD